MLLTLQLLCATLITRLPSAPALSPTLHGRSHRSPRVIYASADDADANLFEQAVRNITGNSEYRFGDITRSTLSRSVLHNLLPR